MAVDPLVAALMSSMHDGNDDPATRRERAGIQVLQGFASAIAEETDNANRQELTETFLELIDQLTE
jgi:hypothetical protein